MSMHDPLDLQGYETNLIFGTTLRRLCAELFTVQIELINRTEMFRK